jgi:2'-5' RNA ligase
VTCSARETDNVPAQSGIIVPVQEAEPIVGHLRLLHDPQARSGVPAHITLLYPFAHPSRVITEVDALRQLFGDVSAFEFLLTDVRRFPSTAYLHPEPAARFVHLAEMIARRWPEYPPYGGAFPTMIPHLTIADRVSPDVLDTVDRAVAARLPIQCRATEGWLMCSDERGFWSRSQVFPFGQIRQAQGR